MTKVAARRPTTRDPKTAYLFNTTTTPAFHSTVETREWAHIVDVFFLMFTSSSSLLMKESHEDEERGFEEEEAWLMMLSWRS
jgi:hypothetical protein